MTEHDPTPDPIKAAMAQDAADLQAEADEHERRHQIVWEQQVRDAETTMDQRDALTRRVRAQASLLETLDVFLWLMVALAVIAGGWYAVARILGAVL